MHTKQVHCGQLLPLLGVLVLAGPTLGQSLPYRTGFEAPLFAVGALGAAGQDGWVGSGQIQSADQSGIRSGEQSLQINETSVVTRAMQSPSGQVIYIDGYYRGPTVNTLPDPATMDSGSSLLLFHQTQGIMALDGDGSGGGTWVSSGVQVSTTSLQRITICQDYSQHTWTLFINQRQAPVETPLVFGFKNNIINQLNGIDIETSNLGKGFLDDFSATTSIPDFFREALFDFSLEWQDVGPLGELNWDVSPAGGQVDADDLVEIITRRLGG